MLALVLATLSALAQLFTAWMGWRVTIRPPVEKDRRKHEVVFVLVGLIGVCFLSFGAYFAAKDQKKLEIDLSDLKKAQQSVDAGITQANAGIAIIKQKVDTPTVNPNSLNKPSPPEAKIERRSRLHISKFELVPPSAEKPIYLNVYFLNSGQVDAEMTAYSLVTLVATTGDISQQIKIEDSLFGSLGEVVKKGGSVPHAISPGGSEVYFTDAGPVLSLEDVKNFVSGRYTAYFVGEIIYVDGAGSRETTYCVYISGYPSATHLCRRHNQEQ
jgi:hypothetical protein